MIAALLDSDGAQDGSGFAQTLQFAGSQRSCWTSAGPYLLAQLTQTPRRAFAASVVQPWRPGRGPSGRLTLFNGQFHNLAAICARLGMAGADRACPADIYALALDRWGDEADEHVIGHYCTITLDPASASLRLSRSPFVAPPLHFRFGEGRAVAASLPRTLFWRSGAARQVNLDRLARSTLIDFTDRFVGWYTGCQRMPLGCAITLTPAEFTESWTYDLFSRPKVRLARDEDYVDAANALLDEGVAAVLADARQPGVLLSGGLDSSQVALSALRQMPLSQKLPSFTYGPQAQWARVAPAGHYAGEFAEVGQLAAAHPRLAPEFFTHPAQDFRHGTRDLLAAMDCGPPGLGLAWLHHDIYARARELGCDVLLTGDWGNLSFSNSAPWAPVEFLRAGRWRRLWQVLRHHPAETRPMWRRFLARSIMPQLPAALFRRAYRLVHGAAPNGLPRSGLSPAWAAEHRLGERARAAGIDIDRMQFASRRQFWQRLMAEDGQDHDQIVQGMSQLYGIALRDPTAYRPLVEFCYGLPTDQFTRGSSDRFLARRMAAGRLPDDLRLNRDLGLHHGDWHMRIGRARGELIEELDRMAGDADIAAVFDLPRLRQTLQDWPEQDPGGAAHQAGLQFFSALSLAIAGGRFIAYVKGRNDI